MKNFIEPKHNPIVLSLAKLLLNPALKSEGLEIRPLDGCLDAFQRLKNRNTIITINHSDRSDPLTVFALSTYVRENFYYLSARELFEQNFGFRGFVMQNCGAYSVIRGEPADAESREATIRYLSTPGTPKLIMFPEGDVSGRDRVMPLRFDGIRNIFNGQGRLHQTKPGENLYILPMAAFYQVQAESVPLIEECLTKLEASLGADQGRGIELPARIERVVDVLVQQLESHYSVESEGADINKRLLRLCETVSLRISEFGHRAHFSDVRPTSLASTLYTARAGLSRWANRPASGSDSYRRRLLDEAAERSRLLTRDLDRIQQLVILSTTLDQDHGNLEFCWRAVDRLEHEVLGKVTPKGTRIAWIGAASPISVNDYFDEFQKDENAAVEHLEGVLRQRMDDQLQGIKRNVRSSHSQSIRTPSTADYLR